MHKFLYHMGTLKNTATNSCEKAMGVFFFSVYLETKDYSN